jgi:hypothetical protein
MNKYLKIALIVIGVIVAIILILGLIMPKQFDVSRTISIDAPKEFVFQKVNSLEKMDVWSPWSKMDPNMQVESSGIEGNIGSIRKWKGNKKVGEGEQEIKEIIPNELIHNEIRFKTPMESTNQVYLKMAESNGKTEVTWQMVGESKFPFNAIGAFVSIDKMIGPDFEKGLQDLKQIVEASLQ